ncbi:hypothetical protein ACLBXJ_15560 [Methylobacterium mesophilicum]
MNAKPGIRISFVLRSLLLLPLRMIAWVVLFIWHFEKRYFPRKPAPVPTTVEGIRRNLAHTDEALADIREIILAGRSKNGLALAQIWLKLQEQQATLQAALDTALAEEARQFSPLAA